MSWSEQLRIRTGIKGEEALALDGKALRHSFDNALGSRLNSYCKRVGKLRASVPGSGKKVAEKSNEITAVHGCCFKMLDIEDCIVTADALNCQTAIAEQITQQGGVFVLALEGQSP